MTSNKRYLFYLVHPAKFHLFRFTINELIKQGHHVDILINSKDVLEELIRQEGWNYYNIFPKGRNRSNKPSIFKSALNFLLTVLKLEFYLWHQRKYDLFITDDALVISGFIRGIKSIIFNDNDIETIKINKILFYFASFIMTPECTDIGSFSKKKLAFPGNKAIAHLHPDYFQPDNKVLNQYHIAQGEYCIIRTSKLNATHDVNNNFGIINNDLIRLIGYVERMKIIPLIFTERILPSECSKYIFRGNPKDIHNLLYYSKFLVTDSGSVATEAAVLGIPNFLINNLAKNVGVHKELLNNKLQLFYNDFSSFFQDFCSIGDFDQLKKDYKSNISNYLSKQVDLNKFILNIIMKKSSSV